MLNTYEKYKIRTCFTFDHIAGAVCHYLPVTFRRVAHQGKDRFLVVWKESKNYTERIKDLDKLNLVQLAYGGKVLGSN